MPPHPAGRPAPGLPGRRGLGRRPHRRAGAATRLRRRPRGGPRPERGVRPGAGVSPHLGAGAPGGGEPERAHRLLRGQPGGGEGGGQDGRGGLRGGRHHRGGPGGLLPQTRLGQAAPGAGPGAGLRAPGGPGRVGAAGLLSGRPPAHRLGAALPPFGQPPPSAKPGAPAGALRLRVLRPAHRPGDTGAHRPHRGLHGRGGHRGPGFGLRLQGHRRELRGRLPPGGAQPPSTTRTGSRWGTTRARWCGSPPASW